jgi:hypothetical protein
VERHAVPHGRQPGPRLVALNTPTYVHNMRLDSRSLCTLATATLLFACHSEQNLSESQRKSIEETLRNRVLSAYDLSKPDVVGSLMSLYAKKGPVTSASAGNVIRSRDSLERGIRAFWVYVGQNMKDPKWEWTSMYIDVLSPNCAVMTATYRVPHTQPNGQPHVIAGAWTAVFEKMGRDWYVVQEHLSDAPAQQ